MTDEIIKKYATHLREIYDERTAGDYTFTGVLSEFLRACEDARHDEFVGRFFHPGARMTPKIGTNHFVQGAALEKEHPIVPRIPPVDPAMVAGNSGTPPPGWHGTPEEWRSGLWDQSASRLRSTKSPLCRCGYAPFTQAELDEHILTMVTTNDERDHG